MDNSLKSPSMTARLLRDKSPGLPLRKIISLLITFYLSYLFLHFATLNAFVIDNTLLIVVNIWIGHLLLNLCTLYFTKNATFGDLLVGIRYQELDDDERQAPWVANRSTFTVTLFYLVVYCTYLVSFSLYAVAAGGLLALLLNRSVSTPQGTRLSVLDWMTGTVAAKR